MAKFRNAVTLAEHQQTALGKLEDGNILWGGVGSGKSRVGMAYYKMTETNEDLYVITTAKKRDSNDWVTEGTRFGVGTARDATFAGVLTVDSWNNLEKYVDVEGQFFIFDEQRLVGNGAWVKAFLKIAKKNRWIMLSATPGDNWLDYIPVFIANGFYRNRTEFKHEHVIYAPFSKYAKVERYVNVQRLVRQRNKILVHMPYPMETVRHPITKWCEYDEIMMARVSHGRWNVFEDKPIRDIADMFQQMRKVTNSDPSRLKAVWEILEKHPRLIIFYNFDYELAILRSLKESEIDFTFSEYNGHKHEPIPDTEKWIYVVQYIAGAESWDCITTNAVCFWSLTYSYKLWEQAHGRIDRMNTNYTDLYYYTLRSQAAIDWAIWRSLKSKKNFQTKHFEMTDEEFADFSYQRREE
jgi:hypothetical protein